MYCWIAADRPWIAVDRPWIDVDRTWIAAVSISPAAVCTTPSAPACRHGLPLQEYCSTLGCFNRRAHLTGGMVGLKSTLEALALLDRVTELSEVLQMDQWPSLGYFVTAGAGALWSDWGDQKAADGRLYYRGSPCEDGCTESWGSAWLVLAVKYYYTGACSGASSGASSGVGSGWRRYSLLGVRACACVWACACAWAQA